MPIPIRFCQIKFKVCTKFLPNFYQNFGKSRENGGRRGSKNEILIFWMISRRTMYLVRKPTKYERQAINSGKVTSSELRPSEITGNHGFWSPRSSMLI